MEIDISSVGAMVEKITCATDLPFVTSEEEWPLTTAIFPYGQAWHEGQTRRNNNPYFYHCIEIMLYMWVRGVITDRRAALAIGHDSIEEGKKDSTKDVKRIQREARIILSSCPDLLDLMDALNRSDIQMEYEHPDALIVRIADTTLNISDYHETGTSASMDKYIKGKATTRIKAFQKALQNKMYRDYEQYIIGSLWSIERHVRLSNKVIDKDYRIREALRTLQRKNDIIKRIPEPLLIFWLKIERFWNGLNRPLF